MCNYIFFKVLIGLILIVSALLVTAAPSPNEATDVVVGATQERQIRCNGKLTIKKKFDQ